MVQSIMLFSYFGFGNFHYSILAQYLPGTHSGPRFASVCRNRLNLP